MLLKCRVSFASLFLLLEINSYKLEEHSILPVKEESSSSFLDYYDFKVERNEPTCRLVTHPNLPRDRITLKGRDCMCDKDCVEYKDCCKDSKFYLAAQQSLEPDYHCLESEPVYVKAKCASGWQNAEVEGLCNKSIQPFDGDDISLKISISNTKSRTTYGNKHCAICNYDQDVDSWSAWNLSIRCGKPPRGYFINKTIHLDKLRISEFMNANNFRLYADVTIEILIEEIFKPNNEIFIGRYNNVDYVCGFQLFLPNNSEEFTRRCIPNMIRSCPKSFTDETIIKECSIRTSVVHQIDSGVSYRNRDCARCNGEKDTNLKGILQLPRSKFPPSIINTVESDEKGYLLSFSISDFFDPKYSSVGLNGSVHSCRFKKT